MDVLHFYSKNPSIAQSINIVKYGLTDSGIPLESKVLAINNVVDMPTHNRVTKSDLLSALRFLFDHYDF